MSTFSFLTSRMAAKLALVTLLSSAASCAVAQAPAVVSTFGAAVPHNEQYGAPWQTAVSNRGDFLLYDFKTDGLYEFPANGGPEITIAAPGVIAGGFTNSGIAVDPRNNNLYLDNNYNGGLIEFPFNPATGMWDLPRQVVANGLNGNLGGSCGNYFQGAGLSINHNGVMAVATENGCGVEIFTVPIDASGNFGAATPIVSNMKGRAKTVAIDDAGNVSFNEDGGQAGILFIPAGTAPLADDTTVAAIFNNQDSTKGPVNSVQGVSTDRSGNLYIADANLGEFFVPLEAGAPNPAHAVLISSIGAAGGPSIDPLRRVLFVPVPNGGTIKDVEKFYIGRVELGAAAFGVSATPQASTYYFNAPTTPYSFVVQENGNAGDFVVSDLNKCGITFPLDSSGKALPEQATAYATGSSCFVTVTFTPHAVGDISATLLMEDQSGKVLNTTLLHGVGQGSRVATLPALETAVGTGLQTPRQVAVDRSGNLYVADSGAGQVLQFASGATSTSKGVNVGAPLTSPTGVAVDDTGNIYVADSGNLLEIPYSVLGTKTVTPVTVANGFGANVKLAADGIGDVFVADPDHQRVVRVRTTLAGITQTELDGFTQLSAIAAAGNGDLYVADGQNLIVYTSFQAGTIPVNTLSGVTGLAVDPSGSVYVSEAAGTFRIPNEAGVLNASDQSAVATLATAPVSVALDQLGNAYVLDATAKNIDMVSLNGSLNLGTLPTITSTSNANATIANTGNVPLNVTGFTSTPDYSETATTCTTSPISVGTTCSATITFNPGPGDDGSLPGQITVQSDAPNAAAVINLIGVGAQLGISKTTSAVNGAPISGAVSFTATVAPSAGTGVTPTGTATLTISGKDAAGVTVVPVVVTQPLTDGATTYSLTQVEAGAYTFAVTYNGDRIYERSKVSLAVAVAVGTVNMVQPATSTLPTYVLSSSSTSQEPTDNSTVPLYYVYKLQINSTDAHDLVGTPMFNSNGSLARIDYGSVAFQTATGPVPCPVPTPVGADGTVLFTTTCLPVDTSNNQLANLFTTFTLTPVFTSSDYKSVTGSAFTITALRHPVVVISANNASLNVTSGSTASTTLTLTSLLGFGTAGANQANNGNNYSLPVGMSCDGLPAHATCSFSYPTPDPSDPNSTDVTATTPGMVVMTVNTNVPVGTSTSSIFLQSKTVLAGLFGFGFLGLAYRRRKSFRSRLTTAFCLVALAGVAASMSACGGGTNGTAGNPILTTPAGTYTVMVSAKQVGSKQVPSTGSTPGSTVTVYGSGNLMSLPFTVNVTVK